MQLFLTYVHHCMLLFIGTPLKIPDTVHAVRRSRRGKQDLCISGAVLNYRRKSRILRGNFDSLFNSLSCGNLTLLQHVFGMKCQQFMKQEVKGEMPKLCIVSHVGLGSIGGGGFVARFFTKSCLPCSNWCNPYQEEDPQSLSFIGAWEAASALKAVSAEHKPLIMISLTCFFPNTVCRRRGGEA